MQGNKYNGIWTQEQKQARQREARQEIFFSRNSGKPNPRMGELLEIYLADDNDPQVILANLKAVNIKDILYKAFYIEGREAEALQWLRVIIDKLVQTGAALSPEFILEFIEETGSKRILYNLNAHVEHHQDFVFIVDFLLQNQSAAAFLQIMQAIGGINILYYCCSNDQPNKYEFFINYLIEKFLSLVGHDRSRLLELARGMIKEIVLRMLDGYYGAGFAYFMTQVFANQTAEHSQAIMRELDIRDVVQRIDPNDNKFRSHCRIMNDILAAAAGPNNQMPLVLLQELGLDTYFTKLVCMHKLLMRQNYGGHGPYLATIQLLLQQFRATTADGILDINLIALLDLKELLLVNQDHEVLVAILTSCLPKQQEGLSQSLIELLGIKELLYKSYIALVAEQDKPNDFTWLLDLMIPENQTCLSLELVQSLGLGDFIYKSMKTDTYYKWRKSMSMDGRFLYLLTKCLPQPTLALSLQALKILRLQEIFAQAQDHNFEAYQQAKIIATVFKQLKNQIPVATIMHELGIGLQDIKACVLGATQNDMTDVLAELITEPFSVQLIDTLDLGACVLNGAAQGRLKALGFIISPYLVDNALTPDLMVTLHIKDAIVAAGANRQLSAMFYLLERCLVQPGLTLPQIVDLTGVDLAVRAFIQAGSVHDDRGYNTRPGGIARLLAVMVKKIPNLVINPALLQLIGLDQAGFIQAAIQCLVHERGSREDLKAILQALPKGADGALDVMAIANLGLRQLLVAVLQNNPWAVTMILPICGYNQATLTALFTEQPWQFVRQTIPSEERQAIFIERCATNGLLAVNVLTEIIAQYFNPLINQPNQQMQVVQDPIEFMRQNQLWDMSAEQLAVRFQAPEVIMEAMLSLVHDERVLKFVQMQHIAHTRSAQYLSVLQARVERMNAKVTNLGDNTQHAIEEPVEHKPQ